VVRVATLRALAGAAITVTHHAHRAGHELLVVLGRPGGQLRPGVARTLRV